MGILARSVAESIHRMTPPGKAKPSRALSVIGWALVILVALIALGSSR